MQSSCSRRPIVSNGDSVAHQSPTSADTNVSPTQNQMNTTTGPIVSVGSRGSAAAPVTTTNAEAAAPDGHSSGREVSRRWRAFQRPRRFRRPRKRGWSTAPTAPRTRRRAPSRRRRRASEGPAGRPGRRAVGQATAPTAYRTTPAPSAAATASSTWTWSWTSRSPAASSSTSNTPGASARNAISAGEPRATSAIGRSHERAPRRRRRPRPPAGRALRLDANGVRPVDAPPPRPRYSISRVSGAWRVSVGSVVGAEPVVDGEGDGARSGAVSSSEGRRTTNSATTTTTPASTVSGPDPSRSDHGTGSRARRGQQTCESSGHGFTAGVPLPEMTL